MDPSSLLAEHVPQIVARIFEVISAISGVLFSGVIFWYGIQMAMTQFERGQLSLGVQIPEWIYGSFIPFGAFFLLLRFIELLIKAVKGQEIAKEDVLADAMAEANKEG